MSNIISVEVVAKDFANWLNENYVPYRDKEWKIRYIKNTEESELYFTTDELFDMFKKQYSGGGSEAILDNYSW